VLMNLTLGLQGSTGSLTLGQVVMRTNQTKGKAVCFPELSGALATSNATVISPDVPSQVRFSCPRRASLGGGWFVSSWYTG